MNVRVMLTSITLATTSCNNAPDALYIERQVSQAKVQSIEIDSSFKLVGDGCKVAKDEPEPTLPKIEFQGNFSTTRKKESQKIVHDAFTLLPEQFIGLFLELKGKIAVSPDIDDACSDADQGMEPMEGKDSPKSCINYEEDDSETPTVFLKFDEKTTKEGLTRELFTIISYFSSSLFYEDESFANTIDGYYEKGKYLEESFLDFTRDIYALRCHQDKPESADLALTCPTCGLRPLAKKVVKDVVIDVTTNATTDAYKTMIRTSKHSTLPTNLQGGRLIKLDLAQGKRVKLSDSPAFSAAVESKVLLRKMDEAEATWQPISAHQSVLKQVDDQLRTVEDALAPFAAHQAIKAARIAKVNAKGEVEIKALDVKAVEGSTQKPSLELQLQSRRFPIVSTMSKPLKD